IKEKSARMAMLQEPRPHGIEKYLGKDLVSGDGEKLGVIDRFVNNRLSDVPEWMVVETGLLGSRDLIVPVAGSSFDEGGVRVPYPKEVIIEEPDLEADEDITSEAESILNAYFGLGASGT